ncbi:N-acetylmuramoyl-L-alanine amidase family protein [Tellurirhabdus bombi]|uniref:N-acetylmuramoyl-L-alanine amidase family protein n=1 Tax=Tellurirhabdus bombi TaxID=2907205 RepID=UPI001F315271|nr:N-acetylmuramoyl-L-alanine amidase [Tellurirhabdus bombi]
MGKPQTGKSRVTAAPPKAGNKKQQTRKTSTKSAKQVKRVRVKNANKSSKVKQQANRSLANKTTSRKPLGGTVFYLASGHGGPDPGAIGRYGRYLLPEDEYAYDVTIRLSQILKQQGATVYMMVQDPDDGIRNEAVLKLDKDEVAYPNLRIPLNQTARLNQTTTAVNRLHARHRESYQRLITIHVDSRSQGQTIDVFFYHHERSAAGRRLAEHIHRRFKTNYRRYQPARSYSGNVTTRSSLYVVRNSHPPTVFIELGNIQNRQDQRRFLLASNRQALASWMAQGILDDYRSRKGQ